MAAGRAPRPRAVIFGGGAQSTHAQHKVLMSRKRPLEDKALEAEPKRKKVAKYIKNAILYFSSLYSQSLKHRRGFDDEIFSETTYYVRNGIY